MCIRDRTITNGGVALKLRVLNKGTAKATDIRISIVFPKDIFVYDIDDIEKMKEPKAPKPVSYTHLPVQVKFRVTPEERALIDKRMEQAGTLNMAAYLRKMAIDGYVVKLELPELRDMISHLRRTSNNFNQIARRVNSTNRIYEDDIHEMKVMLDRIWDATNKVLEKLAAID